VYTLDFEGKSREYEVCHQAALFGKVPLNRQSGRIMERLLDKLESIGVRAQKEGEYQLYDLRLSPPYSIELEQEEFELLCKCFDAMEWRATGIRAVNRTIDWLDNHLNVEHNAQSETRPTRN
jgi:hypothetical protein